MNNLRIKVEVYDKENDQKIDGFDTFLESNNTFGAVDLEMSLLARRISLYGIKDSEGVSF